MFLPFTGDPFLLKKWLDCFEVWKEEVDSLYVIINAPLPTETGMYILKLLEKCHTKKLSYEFVNHNVDHGPALNQMLEKCNEDLILLIEEDGFIFKKGQVDKCFKMIEDGEYDIVASPRGSCPQELWEAENKLWSETPEQQPNFWPNFLFCKRSDLLRTDRHFSATAWKKGDYIPQLDHTVQSEVVPSDTFVWTSIQLRGLGLRVKLLEQYHAMVEDLEYKDKIEGVFDRKAPWIHFGSSSTWFNMLLNPELPEIHGTPQEWEVRAAYWLMCWQDAQEGLPESMKEFSEQYKTGIDRLIKEYTLSEARVRYRAELYRNLVKGII